MTQVEQWNIFERTIEDPQDGNPFLDVNFGARFSHEGKEVEIAGFYDGDGLGWPLSNQQRQPHNHLTWQALHRRAYPKGSLIS